MDSPAEHPTADEATAALPPAELPQFGPYRVDARAGAGGMGEVYLAYDARLERRVAIKAIRDGFHSAEAEGRFWAEARAASALNHPNIITIYDVGTAAGVPYLVMEWVEGETLRGRMKRGGVGIPELLRIGAGIADALAAAHGGGILHRDLKPENVMITAQGGIKVLDFGLASRTAAAGAEDLDRTRITAAGAVLGTPGYMSPEQIRGEALDARTDVFSLGAVLYEMAAGQRAFPGTNLADIQAAVLLRQPEPLTRLNPQAPAPLQWLVERCLAKPAADRLGSMAELRAELAAVSAGSAPAAAAMPANHLPAARTAMIGREAELARLQELMRDDSTRIVTLTGPGGMGKTRLAVELARSLAAEFGGGVWFVPLDRIRQANQVEAEVARLLGVGAAEDKAAAMVQFLGSSPSGPRLLVLDNFEHVLEAALLVARLASERVKIVVTSRAPLRIYGEYEFAVGELASERHGTERAPAVKLFLERAQGLRGAPLQAGQLEAVAAICARLDGLPMAIELAAARTRLLPLPVLLERLRDPLSVLVGGARDLPQRQHTLRDTLDWSYNLLDAQHQMLFRRLSVFVGGATMEAIEAVCDTRQDLGMDLWQGLELLADNNLIRSQGGEAGGEPRFAMYETMREYAQQRLAAAGEQDYTAKAHAAYAMVLAEEASGSTRREYTGPHLFDAELGNLRAAMDWLAGHDQVEWGMRMLARVSTYFMAHRLTAELEGWVERLLASPAMAAQPYLRRWAVYWLADARFERAGDVRAAAEQYRKAWEGFEQAGDEEGLHLVSHRISHALQFLAPEESRSWSERSLALARASGNQRLLAGSLSNHADVIKQSGEFEAAAELYREAARRFEGLGDKENATWALSHEADLCLRRERPEEAERLYREALARFRGLGYAPGMASCLQDLAGLAARAGAWMEARRLYGECLRLYTANDIAALPRVLESLSAVAAGSGDAAGALVLLGAAAAMRQRHHLFTLNPEVRAEVEAQVEAARQGAGAEAAAAWMRGWRLSAAEVIEFALKRVNS